MPALIFLISLSVVSFVAFIVYRKKKETYRNMILPKQKQTVKELIRHLRSINLEVIPCAKANLSAETISLLDVGNFSDNGELLSKARYDDYAIFVGASLCEAFDFSEYINRESLPKLIRGELENFHSKKFSSAKESKEKYLALFPSKNIYGTVCSELCSAQGEAFESWLSFKECAHNLNFVINQWVEEHFELKETSDIQKPPRRKVEYSY